MTTSPVFEQKRRGDKTRFVFAEDGLDYYLCDSGGTVVTFKVPYLELPSPFRYISWTPQSTHLRSFAYIFFLIATLQLLRNLSNIGTSLLAIAGVGVVLFALVFLYEKATRRSYTRVPAGERGNIIVLGGPLHDKVLAELEKQRIGALRQAYAVADPENAPQNELRKFTALLTDGIISAQEYTEFCRQLGLPADLPALPIEAPATPLLIRQNQLGVRTSFAFYPDYLEFSSQAQQFRVRYYEIAPVADGRKNIEDSSYTSIPVLLVIFAAVIWLMFDARQHNWTGREGLLRLLQTLCWVVPLGVLGYYGARRWLRNSYTTLSATWEALVILETANADQIRSELEKRREQALAVMNYEPDEDEDDRQTAEGGDSDRLLRLLEDGEITEDEYEILSARARHAAGAAKPKTLN